MTFTRWMVEAWPHDSVQPAVRVEVEAPDQWRAILAAGRAGHIPVNVREIVVRPLCP